MATSKPMMKSTGKVAPSKMKKTMPSKTSKSKMSSMGLENPIGPKTKKESKVKAIPPYTQSKSVEVKAAKRKDRIKSAAVIGSAIIGTVGTIAADARLGRGNQRYKDQNLGNVYAPKPTMKQKWNLGKSKKSTKK